MGRTSRQDPLKSFRYRLTVPGFKRSKFRFCSGLHSSTEQIKYREGGDNETARKSPGLTEYDNITLRRGVIIDNVTGTVTGDLDLYIWRMQVASVKTAGYNDYDFRRDPIITLVGRDGSDAANYQVYEAYPEEMRDFSDLDALGNEDLVEELVLANEGWEREGAPSPPAPGQTLRATLGL